MDKPHVVEKYKVRANTVLCVCGFFGNAEEFRLHIAEERRKAAQERKEKGQARCR